MREGYEVYLRPAAGRAGHKAHAALLEARCPQYLHARADLLHRVRRQRDPYRVAYALHEQRAYAHRGLYHPAVGRTRLRHAQVQRIGQLRRRQPVGRDRQLHRRRLHRERDVVKAAVVQELYMPLCRLQHSLRSRVSVLRQKRLFQAAAVHAYPYRDIM